MGQYRQFGHFLPKSSEFPSLVPVTATLWVRTQESRGTIFVVVFLRVWFLKTINSSFGFVFEFSGGIKPIETSLFRLRNTVVFEEKVTNGPLFMSKLALSREVQGK